MKGFLTMFLVFFGIYSVINIYICIRGASVLPNIQWPKILYFILFILFAASFIVERVLRNVLPETVSGFLAVIGSYWFAFMLFFLVALLFIDMLRIINHFTNFFPGFITNNIYHTKLITAAIVILCGIVVNIAGYANANNVTVKTLPITINKKAGELASLKAVLISDIHLGRMIRRAELAHIVELSNRQEPDIVLLCGDIFDEDITPVKKYNANELLASFKSKYGTFAVTGNHEYIGDAKEAVDYLEQSNINVLRDEALLIDKAFYVIGRDDYSSGMRDGNERLPLKQIVEKLEVAKPMILMDHQPRKLEETAENKIDLQVSGHTHAGQIWPFSYIVYAVWDVAYGYAVKDKSQFYVTSGAGTWGPRVRIGNKPEIVVLNIGFEK